MVLDDHGLEVIRKAGLQLTPGLKDNYAIKVYQVNDPGSGGGMVNTTPLVSVLPLTTNGTEYSVTLPGNCKGFKFKARTLCRIKFNYISIVGDNYFSIPIGGGHSENNFYTNQTLFFIADKDNIDLEIITFV
jgi:hypothetical protein